ncbi:hypothetical protein METBIDRAFT_36718 [Metschnikowia bicuspidata var. bicuspidata NRRL YB-4993]|uniref:Uncharacterized protein n=1 Tax=Metschnikowia bicuspidata var. bicuspidata NRRL YB-4993 TaxID=869754 RepID=A0A1A0HG16_9ASCO|nr:hypothetical protein METBIDRAFT_36718 [Metschnikowia bicuspidata var. bicuspidata NRRL YB-4993]OBA22798.1 hypothetical protein METBIDRAFT_36718 [Metschnikowia bicuspidata var. bicuspidata NRRL YB-4993]
MADEKNIVKLHIPRLRVPSHTLNEASYNSMPNVSQRTVSSSTSLLSTPSNNIRRVQQQMNAQARPSMARLSRAKAPDVCFAGVSSTATASKKLLNLQQLRRAQTNPRPFVLRKPATMAKYDYSAFVDCHTNSETGDVNIPPLVKDSQVRAWKSAEKISAEIIFENGSSSSSPNDTTDVLDEGDGNSLNEDARASVEGCDTDEAPSASVLLESIPQYTKGELKVILKNYRKLQNCASPPSYYELEDTEKKELWLYRQHQSVTQERAFTANHTLLGKRKVQVFHKKEFLHKLFGYSNNINQECTTNNTSYSASDNAFNAQKAFHEDKEEILGLLAEDKAFEEELKTAKEHLLALVSKPGNGPDAQNKVFDQPMDTLDLLDLTNSWLTSSYEKQSGHCDSEEASECEPDQHPEVIAYTMGLLKRRVRDAFDDHVDMPAY